MARFEMSGAEMAPLAGMQPTAESYFELGIHYATEQCHDLLDHGVDGIHFYTLNKSHATREIYSSLGIRDSAAVRPQS